MSIMTRNRAAHPHTAGTDNTAADRMSGDTIRASHSPSPHTGLEEMFTSQGNITGDKEDGTSGLPSNESSEPMIHEVSNQIKDLMEVMKTLASNQRQTQSQLEGLGADVLEPVKPLVLRRYT